MIQKAGEHRPRPKRLFYGDEVKAKLMRRLAKRAHRLGDRRAELPVGAYRLAAWLQLPGADREGKRRRVRELVQVMRAEGAPIASGPKGYWLAATHEDHERFIQFMRRMGLAHLATASRAKKTAAYAAAGGQMRLAPLAQSRGVKGALNFYRSFLERVSNPVEVGGDGETGWLFGGAA